MTSHGQTFYPTSRLELPRGHGRVCCSLAVLISAMMVASCTTRAERGVERSAPNAVDAFAVATAPLMEAGATRSILVVGGDHFYTGEYELVLEAVEDGSAVRSAKAIGFADTSGPPSLAWRLSGNRCQWSGTAASAPAPGRPGALIASIEIRAKNDSNGPASVQCRFRLERPARALYHARDFEEIETTAPRWWAHDAKAPIMGLATGRNSDSVFTVTRTIAAGEDFSVRVLLPSHPIARGLLEATESLPHQEWLRSAEDAWKRSTAPAAQLAVGDPEVELASRSALWTLLGCREVTHRGWSPIGNPFQYRDTWIRDSARQIAALSGWGFPDTALVLADALARFELPDGGFLSQRSQLDATGQVLWALDQAIGRAPQRPIPAPLLGAITRGASWMNTQCLLVSRFSTEAAGLMPPVDPRDNELAAGYAVGTDLWAHAGFHSAAAILKRSQRPELAVSIEAWGARHEEAMRTKLERSGSRGVPAMWFGNARDWGNLIASYPSGFLSASDPRIDQLLDRLWRVRGRHGLVSYGDPDSLHGYLGADLGTVALLRGDSATWDSILTETMHWRTGTGGIPELFSASKRTFGANLPPHTTSAAALLTMLRNALVCDDVGDTLRLTLGTRDAWWRSGAFHGVTTRWGVLDLTFQASSTKVRWTWTSVPVWSTLTLPPGRRIRGTVAPPLKALSPHQVLAPPGTSQVEVPCEIE